MLSLLFKYLYLLAGNPLHRLAKWPLVQTRLSVGERWTCLLGNVAFYPVYLCRHYRLGGDSNSKGLADMTLKKF